MKCSFIVSAFNRPTHLAGLLYSLEVQTEKDFEVIVTDNGRGPDALANRLATEGYYPNLAIRYENPRLTDCYGSANFGADLAKGEYLCFASDDNYYVPGFLETMLKGQPADLIYCDCVFDGYGLKYGLWDTQPKLGQIDKGGFLMRAKVFPGFNGAPAGPCAADGAMIELVVAYGVTLAKVPGLLWVHN